LSFSSFRSCTLLILHQPHGDNGLQDYSIASRVSIHVRREEEEEEEEDQEEK